MRYEPEGYRVIEDGRVVLVKADLIRDLDKIQKIFKELNVVADHKIVIDNMLL